jgi:mycofactocin system glycosyltransferase
MSVLPEGWGLVVDPSVQTFRHGTVMAGGHPGRIMTCTPAGVRALATLTSPSGLGSLHDNGSLRDKGDAGGDLAARTLAGRLVDAGMAHPRPPARPARSGASSGTQRSLTIIVPAFGRPETLARCLASLGREHPVLVVDDASPDGAAIAEVCRLHGATLERRTVNGGPGASRSTGLALSASELVAFVDSDTVVPEGWLDGLTWCFDDPTVGAVAPRIRPVGSSHAGRSSVLQRFLAERSPLDLGPLEGPVGPRRQVRYLPTAALVVRRRALEEVEGFDSSLRVGEDVDLLWRLSDAGWQIRYLPDLIVEHAEPNSWRRTLARRFRYGTSAGPLAVKHPGRLAPVELAPLPTIAAVGILASQPLIAGLAASTSAVRLVRAVRPSGIPTRTAVAWAIRSVGWTIVGMGRASTLVAAPALVGIAVSGRRGRRAAVAMAAAPALVEWVNRRPDLDPVRWAAACLADDAAYGAGVWWGALRHRTLGPMLPARTTRS